MGASYLAQLLLFQQAITFTYVNLKGLFILTGIVRVEGGDAHTARQTSTKRKKREGADEKITIVHKRIVTADRRAANVISTDYMRRARRLRVLQTPYGGLVLPANLPALQEMIASATKDVAEYNATPDRSAVLSNCLLWEPLAGNRLAAVQGWMQRQLMRGDEDVRAAVSLFSVGGERRAG